MVASREWHILRCRHPHLLKPDIGVVLTERLDARDCLMIYPISPFVCFVATGDHPSYTIETVERTRVHGLNRHILEWSDRSVACACAFWHSDQRALTTAVREHLRKGDFVPPSSGRFFSMETLECESALQCLLLAPRGPRLFTIPKQRVRPVEGPQIRKVPGLYEVADIPDVAWKIRYSDNEDEVDLVSLALVLHRAGRGREALAYAKKALASDPEELVTKLIVLCGEPEAPVGELKPKSAEDAADLALWLAQVKKEPLEGLQVTSPWLGRFPEHDGLIGANFLCAFLHYGHRFIDLMLGKEKALPYLAQDTPIPDGVPEFLEKLLSLPEGPLVHDVQRGLCGMDVTATGITADILRLAGANFRLRLYRESASES